MPENKEIKTIDELKRGIEDLKTKLINAKTQLAIQQSKLEEISRDLKDNHGITDFTSLESTIEERAREIKTIKLELQTRLQELEKELPEDE